MPDFNGVTDGPPQFAADGNGASGTREQVQQRAQEAAGQAQEKVQEVGGRLQARLREQLDNRSSKAGQQINERAEELRSVSQALREQGKDGPAKAADQVADYTERAARYLTEKDSAGVLADAEDLGRRQPWAIVAGGAAMGFMASRFLKASSSRRYRNLTTSRPVGVYPGSPATRSQEGSASPESRPLSSAASV
jgi:ElaB/YqjD/DUF883 family membrane-anchored ribosome-binding protein